MSGKNTERSILSDELKAPEASSDPTSTHGSSMKNKSAVMAGLGFEGLRGEMERLSQENKRLREIIISLHLEIAGKNAALEAYQRDPSPTKNEEKLEKSARIFDQLEEAPQRLSFGEMGSIADDTVYISSLRSFQTDSDVTVLRDPQRDESPTASLEHETPIGQSVIDHSCENESQRSSGSHLEGKTIQITGSCKVELFGDESGAKAASDSGTLDTRNNVRSNDGEAEGEKLPTVLPGELVPRIASGNGSSDACSSTQNAEVTEGVVSNFWTSRSGTGSSAGISSIYDIPNDFDPDQEDYGLSDVETVKSDEALSAWGIEEPSVLEQTQKPLPRAEIKYDNDNDGEGGLEAANKNYRSASEPHLMDQISPAPQDRSGWHVNNANKKTEGDINEDGDEDEDEDDISTILGDPGLANPATTAEDDDKASTVAETGSDGYGDEIYKSLMSQIEEEILIDDMEKERERAEKEEMDERHRQYSIAIAEKDAGATKKREDSGDFQSSDKSPTLSSTPMLGQGVGIAPGRDSGIGYNKSLGDTRAPQIDPSIVPQDHVNNKTVSNIPSSTRGSNPEGPGLLEKFNEIWSTLTPTGPANGALGNLETVGWVKPKPKGDAETTAQEQPNTQIAGKLISESDRILLSFGPKEDVILQPKAKGEQSVLDRITSNATPDIPKKIKVTKGVNKIEDSVKEIGEIESQFKILRDQKLERRTEQKEGTACVILPAALETGVGSSSPEALQDMQTPSTNRLASDMNQTPALANQILARVKAPSALNRTPKASHRVSPPPSIRKGKGFKTTSPPLLKQMVSRASSSHEALRDEEPELSHRKSLRFQDSSTQDVENNRMSAQSVRPSMVVQTTVPALNPPKLLVSILKTVEKPTILPKYRTYNYEYIREVSIRGLPKDITYSSFLDQVSGGLLEKVIIDWNSSEARIVFAEPEAARKFFRKVEQDGFWVHTQMPHIGLVGNENLVQCTLGGFLWTQHSSEMTPAMIQSIWTHRSTRCLLLNNFPKSITVAKLRKDILNILAEPSNRDKDIIETTAINHNLNVSGTGLLASVRFSAIMFALKVSKELHNSSPEYTGVSITYDADPCGGLMGKEPPVSGKETLNDNQQGQGPTTKLPELQLNLTPSTQGTPKPQSTKRTQASQESLPKQFAAQSRHIAPKPSRPKGPINQHIRSQLTKNPPIAPAPTQAKWTQPIETVVTARPPAAITESQTTQSPVPPPRIFGHSYDNWDTDPVVVEPRPQGAHWNHKEPHLVREYNDAIFNNINKRVRKNSDASNTIERFKTENSKVDNPLIDRLVYLTNLPRNFHAARLFRFIRGGMVEHVELRPPTSKYNTSSAIIVFTHRHSAKTYKNYLNSPGLTVEHNHRVAYAENIAPELVGNIRLLAPHSIRNEGLTRCLRVDLLPKDTMLGEFLGIIEEGMNHSNLEFEHASIDVSQENHDSAVASLRLMTIGTAIFVVNVLKKNYDDINIMFDVDPCQGPVAELDEVNLETSY